MKKIASIYSLDQKQEWLKALSKFKRKDAFFFPEYAKLYEVNGDGQAQAFVYEENSDSLLYVFMKRRINDLPFMDSESVEYFDIITPYGYTGPLCSTTNIAKKKTLLKGFFNSFERYCRRENIVSEFIRFHPFLKTHEGCEPYINLIKRCDNVYLDLTKSKEKIWQGYQPARRNKIRQAKKNKLGVFCDKKLEHMEEFIKLYNKTMEKIGASDYFLFPKEYFMFIKNKLKNFFVLFFTRTAKGRPIAGSLFLFWKRYIHYFLSGSEQEFLNLRPNDLLLHEVALWAKENGYQFLHYGGGERGVYQFKASFSEDRADYFIAKVVRNEQVYRAICEKWRKYYPDKAEKEISFFPLYRS